MDVYFVVCLVCPNTHPPAAHVKQVADRRYDADDIICSRPLFAPYNSNASQQVAYPALRALKGPFAPPRMGAGRRSVPAALSVRPWGGFFFSFVPAPPLTRRLVREDLHEDIGWLAGRLAGSTGVETCIQTGRVLVMLLGKPDIWSQD